MSIFFQEWLSVFLRNGARSFGSVISFNNHWEGGRSRSWGVLCLMYLLGQKLRDGKWLAHGHIVREVKQPWSDSGLSSLKLSCFRFFCYRVSSLLSYRTLKKNAIDQYIDQNIGVMMVPVGSVSLPQHLSTLQLLPSLALLPDTVASSFTLTVLWAILTTFSVLHEVVWGNGHQSSCRL